jgi:hypothetical protein
MAGGDTKLQEGSRDFRDNLWRDNLDEKARATIRNESGARH